MQVQSEHVQHTPGPAVYNPQNVKSRIPSRGLSKYPAYRVIRDFCDERNLTMPNVVFANPELIPMGIYGTDRVPQGTRGLYDPATQTIYLQDPNDEGIGLHELLHYWGHVKTGNPGHYVYP